MTSEEKIVKIREVFEANAKGELTDCASLAAISVIINDLTEADIERCKEIYDTLL